MEYIRTKEAELRTKEAELRTKGNLFDRIQTLERWKNSDAIPKINANISEINQLFSNLNKTKVDLKSYTDSLILSTKDDIGNEVNSVLSSFRVDVQDYVVSTVDSGKADMKSYTDSLVNLSKSDMKNYIDSLIASTKTELKGYTDSLIVSVKNEFVKFKSDIAIYIENTMATIKTDITSFKVDIKNYVNSLITTSKTEITNHVNSLIINIESDIEAFKINIKQNLDSLVVTAKNEIGNWVVGFVGNPELDICHVDNKGTIMGFLCVTQNEANTAIAKATAIVDKLKKASIQLNVDVGYLQTASDTMITTLTTEILNIQNQFIAFGTAIKTSAKGIVEKTIDVRDEFTEAYNQVNAPLAMVKEYARRCKDDNIIFLPHNIFMMAYWGFFRGL